MEIIYLTRAQALSDGVLIDVTKTAQEAGFHNPVALTRSLWDRYVHVADSVSGQDETDRLRDILSMFHFALTAWPRATNETEVRFQVLVLNAHYEVELVWLKAVWGPGNDGEPVITVMLPSED